MQLKDFITGTISQIVDSVFELQEQYKDKDVIINPDTTLISEGEYTLPPNATECPKPNRIIQFLEMDIALSVTENNNVKSNVGVATIIKAGVASHIDNKNSNISNVKFNIPIGLPATSTVKFLEKKQCFHNE